MPNPPIEASDTLVVQIAAQLKPILSMRFQEKFTVEQLEAAIRDAVLRVPEKFKRAEKVRAVHRKKGSNESDSAPSDTHIGHDSSPHQGGNDAVHAAQPPVRS